MTRTVIWKRLFIWAVCIWGLLFALPNAFYPAVERHNDALALSQTEPPPVLLPNFVPSALVISGNVRACASAPVVRRISSSPAVMFPH